MHQQVPPMVARRGDSKAWEERGRWDRGVQGRWHHRALDRDGCSERLVLVMGRIDMLRRFET